jgi:predicted ArsR family transcriptional regulator
VRCRGSACRPRGGPGRPAKLYRRADDEVAVSVPERHYDVVGDLLATAVSDSIATGAAVQEVLSRTAYDAGRSIGAAAGDLTSALAEAGYEPGRDEAGVVECATSRSTGSPGGTPSWSAG